MNSRQYCKLEALGIAVLLLTGLFSTLFVSLATGQTKAKNDDTKIVGVDLNKNGVRDDIEARIDEMILNDSQKAAALHLARDLEKILVEDSNNPLAMETVSKSIGESIHCLVRSFKSNNSSKAVTPSDILTQIESFTFDNAKRSDILRKFNKARTGTVSTLPNRVECPH